MTNPRHVDTHLENGKLHVNMCAWVGKGRGWGRKARGGGGGHSGTEGGRTCVTYFAEEGVFFKTACPLFCKRRVLFCTQVRSMVVRIPLQSTKDTRL